MNSLLILSSVLSERNSKERDGVLTCLTRGRAKTTQKKKDAAKKKRSGRKGRKQLKPLTLLLCGIPTGTASCVRLPSALDGNVNMEADELLWVSSASPVKMRRMNVGMKKKLGRRVRKAVRVAGRALRV